MTFMQIATRVNKSAFWQCAEQTKYRVRPLPLSSKLRTRCRAYQSPIELENRLHQKRKSYFHTLSITFFRHNITENVCRGTYYCWAHILEITLLKAGPLLLKKYWEEGWRKKIWNKTSNQQSKQNLFRGNQPLETIQQGRHRRHRHRRRAASLAATRSHTCVFAASVVVGLPACINFP